MLFVSHSASLKCGLLQHLRDDGQSPRHFLQIKRLGGDLLAEELLEGLAIDSELLDALVELVERHGVL